MQPSCDGNAALRVLSDPHLFRAAVSFASGWSGHVRACWRLFQTTVDRPRAMVPTARNPFTHLLALQRGTPRQFMDHLLRIGDLKTLHFAMDAVWFIWGERHRFTVASLIPAIDSGNATVVKWAATRVTLTNNQWTDCWTSTLVKCSGDCSILDALYESYPLTKHEDIKRMQQHLATLLIMHPAPIAWLVHSGHHDCLPQNFLEMQALVGRVDMVQAANTIQGQVVSPNLFGQVHHKIQTATAYKDDGALAFRRVLEYLLVHLPEIHPLAFEMQVFDANDVETLALIHRTRGLRHLSGVSIDRAAELGHLAVIQFIVQYYPVTCTSVAMDRAASRGHLDMVQYLHGTGAVACTMAAMDDAAANGHLKIVEFLHANRTEGCTATAMDGAARNGHINVVQFLIANRTEGCSAETIDHVVMTNMRDMAKLLIAGRVQAPTTAATDHVVRVCDEEMLLLLHSSGLARCSEAAFAYKVGGSGREILLFLLQHRDEPHPPKLEVDAFQAGDLQLLQWIQQHRGLQHADHINIDAAAGQGRLGLIQFLSSGVERPSCTTLAMDWAAANGHLHVIHYLHEHRTEGCTKAAMDMAANFGHWDIVAFLADHRSEGCSVIVLHTAIRIGRLDLVEKYAAASSRMELQAALYVSDAFDHAGIIQYLQTRLVYGP